MVFDVLGEALAGYCHLFPGMLGALKKDSISVLCTYPDIAIQRCDGFRVLPRSLIVCQSETHLFGAWFNGHN